MVVIVEFSVPSDSFKFGSLLSLNLGVEVNVEQLVPVGGNVMPFSWVSGDIDSFERGLDSEGVPYEVILENDNNGRTLYRLEWNAEGDELIQAILESNGSVLDATGTSERWVFRVRFRERQELSEFHASLADKDMRMTVNRIYNPIEVSGNSRSGMTLTQTQTLLDALEEGYYDIPRKTSLVELSEMYGISDQAVSERLRRATAELIESSLVEHDEGLYLNEVGN